MPKIGWIGFFTSCKRYPPLTSAKDTVSVVPLAKTIKSQKKCLNVFLVAMMIHADINAEKNISVAGHAILVCGEEVSNFFYTTNARAISGRD